MKAVEGGGLYTKVWIRADVWKTLNMNKWSRDLKFRIADSGREKGRLQKLPDISAKHT